MIGVLLYGKILSFDLTYLDDNVWVGDYHWYLKDISNAFRFFVNPDLLSGVFYRPILNLSFLIDAQIGGKAYWVYHLTNILIHLTNVALLFILLQKMSYSRTLSYFFALLFLVHPVLTQAVAWIPGRTDSLLAVFVLSSFIFFLDYLKNKETKTLITHLALMLCALLTKETGIALAVMCFLYTILIDSKNKTVNRKYLFASWFGLVGAWFLWRQWILSGSSLKVDPLVAVTSVLENFPSIISYVGKSSWPFELAVLPVLEDLKLVYGLIAIGVIVTLLILSTKKRISYVLFGLAWFVLFMLPSLVISFLNHEYRLYLPIIGLIFILLEIDWIKNVKTQRHKQVFMAVIAVFFMITSVYSESFKDRITFWESAVESSPHNALAHRNLGAMYYLDGRKEEAAVEFKEALKLNPREAMVHNNLGLIYMDKGDMVSAEREYLEEIRINPTYDNVYFNYGLLCFRQKRFKEAEAMWKHVIKLNPKYITAYENLALFYYQKGDQASARYYVNELKKRGIVLSQLLQNLTSDPSTANP